MRSAEVRAHSINKSVLRLFFEIAYKGTRYHGWQYQKNALSIQEVVTDKLSTILKNSTGIVASGRTDKGVHASQQYFHSDINQSIDPNILMKRLNAFLPDDISIKSIRRVKSNAHARFDAVKRSYEYRIIPYKDPFLVEFTYRYNHSLDLKKMNIAADLLKGEKNFKSFSRVKTDVSHFSCKVYKARWELRDNTYIFEIQANRFLRGMVRSIVGTLLDIGIGKLTVEKFSTILKAEDRRAAGRAAPAKGLTLTCVEYPEEIFLP